MSRGPERQAQGKSARESKYGRANLGFSHIIGEDQLRIAKATLPQSADMPRRSKNAVMSID